MPKPEINLFDNTGVHGMDVLKTSERLEKEGMWKRQRIIMLLPSATMVDAKAAMSWLNLVWPPNQGVVKLLLQGMEVGAAYTEAIEQILAHKVFSEFEYILTVEHDNLPPADGVLNLIKSLEERPDVDCMSGLYFTKGDGGCAQIWGDPKDPVLNYRPCVPRDGEVVECNGVGMGFALWRMQVFKHPQITKPFFKTEAGPEGGGTQDLYFWRVNRGLGFKCAVDCRVKVGHIDTEGTFGVPGMVY